MLAQRSAAAATVPMLAQWRRAQRASGSFAGEVALAQYGCELSEQKRAGGGDLQFENIHDDPAFVSGLLCDVQPRAAGWGRAAASQAALRRDCFLPLKPYLQGTPGSEERARAPRIMSFCGSSGMVQ